jgi:hypothetical protein
MARLTSWRDEITQSYTGAKKWGTGINPIHSQKGGYEGRNLAPGNEVQVDPGFDNNGYTSFEFDSSDYGTGGVDLTFMSQHPNWGERPPRGKMDMPSWGRGPFVAPNGTGKRLVGQGRNPKENSSDPVPTGAAGEGWENKVAGNENDAETSDPRQYEMQTSMSQRHNMRDNGLAVSRTTDSPRAGISPRLAGVKIKVYSGGRRHFDMTPYDQDYIPRSWRFRGAGTGPVEYLDSNAYESVSPVTRVVPGDVDQGMAENELTSDDGYGEWM